MLYYQIFKFDVFSSQLLVEEYTVTFSNAEIQCLLGLKKENATVLFQIKTHQRLNMNAFLCRLDKWKKLENTGDHRFFPPYNFVYLLEKTSIFGVKKTIFLESKRLYLEWKT